MKHAQQRLVDMLVERAPHSALRCSAQHLSACPDERIGGQISALARLILSQLLAQADEKLLAPKSGFFGGAHPQGLSPVLCIINTAA